MGRRTENQTAGENTPAKKPRTEKQLASDERLRLKAVETRKKKASTALAKAQQEAIDAGVSQTFSGEGSSVDISTDDVEHGQEHEIDLASNIQDIDRTDLAEVVNANMETPEVKQYVKELAFMEDILTVTINESTDPNADNPVSCGVNGVVKHLMRGMEYKIERKFVESLIKREDTIKTKQYLDGNDVQQTKIVKTPALKYPMQIHNDPAGQTGREWFQWQCKNPS